MATEVMGVSLKRFEDPISAALKAYQEISNGALSFDINNASKLEATPALANSARSATEVLYQGVSIGKLFVIAFKPGDGTGSEVSHKLEELEVDQPYPREILVVPRSKSAAYSEGHMTVATQQIDDVHADPVNFAGTFDLLGLDGNKIVKIAELGQVENEENPTALTTLTTGYQNNERFGDPHAVYSRVLARIQVCAFLAISNEVQKEHPDILDTLNPQFPRT
jgi:hypothetical protein